MSGNGKVKVRAAPLNTDARSHRLMKRWPLPKGCDVAAVVLRELDAGDDIEAAINADKYGSAAARETIQGSMMSTLREKMRMSLVAFTGLNGKTTTIPPGVPFMAMNGWSMKTMRFIERGFHKLNSVDDNELALFDAGAEMVAPGEIAAPVYVDDETEEETADTE